MRHQIPDRIQGPRAIRLVLIVVTLACAVTVALMPASAYGQTLTQILRTDKPIAGARCEVAGSFTHGAIDRGTVAVALQCSSRKHILFWDGTEVTKIADDGTPVPGLSGSTLLFDDLELGRTEITLVGGTQPRVLFRASHATPARYALYEWRPDTGINVFPSSGPEFKGYVYGTLASNGEALIWTRPTLEQLPELHFADAEGNTRLFLGPEEALGNTRATIEYYRNAPPLFNGQRVLAKLSTVPESEQGWWSLEPGQAVPVWKSGYWSVPPDQATNPVWEVGTAPIASPSDASILYSTIEVLDISPAHASSQSAVAIGEGPDREGRAGRAMLYSPNAGAPFQVIHETTQAVPGRPTFTFIGFGTAEILGDSVVFDGLCQDSNGKVLAGIYEWRETGSRTLIDSTAFREGVPLVRLLGRDDHGDGLLVAAYFNPNDNPFILDGAFDSLYVMSTGSSLSLDDWLSQELRDFGQGETVTGFNADPDGDGVANLLEYALGGDPGKKDIASTFPGIGVGSDGIAIDYTRRAGLPEEIAVTAEVLDPLTQQWVPAGDTVEESVTPSARPGFDRVTIRPLVSSDSLYRIRVNHRQGE